jgi:hypothetical protein
MSLALKLGLLAGGVAVLFFAIGAVAVVLLVRARGGGSQASVTTPATEDGGQAQRPDPGKPIAPDPRARLVLEITDEVTNNDPFDRVRVFSRHKQHRCRMLAGRTYTVELVGAAFDGYLRLDDAQGVEVGDYGDMNARSRTRMVFRPARDFDIRICVTAQDRTGPYTLRVWESPSS